MTWRSSCGRLSRGARRGIDLVVHAPFMLVLTLVLYAVVASPGERWRTWRRRRDVDPRGGRTR